MYLLVILSVVMLLSIIIEKKVFAGENNTGDWGDNGDGTYNNPVLPADYSDPDIIRVGKDYFLIASTFQLSPGLTVLHSADLINWRFIGSAVKDLTQLSPRFNYDKMDGYGRCIWAPCITYNKNNKTFYIHFGTPDEGYFMVKTQDIFGEWSDVYEVKKVSGEVFGFGWDDCGVLWDDDGVGYFIGANFADNYQGYLFKISDDGYSMLDEGVKVHRTGDEYRPSESSPEAYKIFKKDGIYYFYHNGVDGDDRKAFLLCSENIYGTHTDGTKGTFENPGKYEHIPYPIVEGFRGPCQGNVIDAIMPDGSVKWYFWTHQGRNLVDGRPDSLLPLKWVDGWAKADMLWTNIEKPFSSSVPMRPATSDDFDSEKLAFQWMWNFQPRSDKWSLSERKGYMRLYAFMPIQTDRIDTAGNTLLQRSYKTEDNVATTKIDISKMVNGQNAGLLHEASSPYTAIGVCVEDDKKYLRYLTKNKSIIGDILPEDTQYIYFKSEWKIDCINRFFYSFDDITYIPFGEEYQLIGATYRGDYVGIYNYNNISDKGYIDVDYLKYDMK